MQNVTIIMTEIKLPKISCIIPYYDMENGAFFLKRAIDSVMTQTYKNYEIVLTKDGKMAENTNSAIKRATGDLIKILYMDDYLAHKDALKTIVEGFTGHWLVTACEHDDGTRGSPHYPRYSDSVNTIGSPSVLTIKNGLDMYFDESMSWTLDLDFYKRLHAKYGEPTILNDINVVIGIHDGQHTNILSDVEKQKEEIALIKKYDKSALSYIR